MHARQITDGYAVSPQIGPEDIPEIAAQGFRTIICNRPDGEVTDELLSDRIEEAARAAGLEFVRNPIESRASVQRGASTQRRLVAERPGPVLAYCASGTRSAYVWGLGEAGYRSANEIIESAAKAGYDLEPLRSDLS